MKWTTEQDLAIKSRGKDIIISAAAGSGKTAVVIQRIFELIQRDKVEVKNLLILTFTNAAAKEMKDRLMEKFYDYLEENPKDSFIKKQLKSMHLAKISTMHSFCISIIRENFHHLDIDPEFKIASTSLVKILKSEAIEEIFEQRYENEDEDFLKLVDIYSSRRDDAPLAEMVLKTHSFILNRISPFEWLKESYCFYQKDDIEDTAHMKIYKEEILFSLNNALSKNALSIEECQNYGELKAWEGFLEDERSKIENLILALEKSYFEFLNGIKNFKFERWPNKKIEDEIIKAQKDEIKSLRDEYKNDLSKASFYYDKILSQTLENNKEIMPLLKELSKLVEDFDKLYKEKKKSQKALDFNDLEHITLKMLSDDEIRNLVSKKYSHIFYDEFQDSNEVHNKIIESLKNDDNQLFFVGDVKQSIYGFRNAEPEVFTKKYREYKNNEETLAIDLNENFRSSRQILEFCNFLFENMMSENLGGVRYDESVSLKTSNNSEISPKNISLNFITSGDEEFENSELEAISCGKKIREIVGSSYKDSKNGEEKTYKFSDIAILIRSPRPVIDSYKSIFKQMDIPLLVDSQRADFDVIEVAIVIDFLKIIDNPLNDDALLSVMNSHIGGFDMEELANIRGYILSKDFSENKEIKDDAEDKKSGEDEKIKSYQTSFYDSCMSYMNEVDDESSRKLSDFFESLKKYRNFEKNTSLFDFIQKILDDKGYFEYISVLPYGGQRILNVKNFMDIAEEFEEGRKCSLHHFLVYLEKIIAGKGDTSAPLDISPDTDVVRLMSIHKSKGLEFPVVIMPSLSKQFNVQDMKEDLQLNSHLGMGINYHNEGLSTKYTTIPREAIKSLNQRELLSEEMRIFYVAATRAKSQLHMFAAISEKQLFSKLEKDGFSQNSSFGEAILSRKKSYLEWLLYIFNPYILKMAEELENKSFFLKEKGTAFTINFLEEMGDVDERFGIDEKEEFINKIKNADLNNAQRLFELFDFEYPHEEEKNMRVKDSVTGILEESHENYKIEKVLDFKNKGDKNKIDAAKIGSITHYLIEKINYSMADENSYLQNLLDDMVNKKMITEEEKDMVDLKSVENLLKSDLGGRIKNSDRVHKESPFIMEYENLILNGVIDLFFIENNEIVVVDFKTDRITELNKKEKIDTYSKQINIYIKALEEGYNMRVKEGYIYFLSTGESIAVY